MDSFIKLYSRFLEWGWHDDPNMVSLFIHLLLMANYEAKEWHGITIERGQFVGGRKVLAEMTGISEQTIRTCLSRLESTGEITRKSTNKFSIITITKYDSYQQSLKADQPTTNQQLTNNQPTTNHTQKIKKLKNNTNSAKTEISEMFDRLWKLYPNKRGRSQISEKTKKAIYDIGEEEMTRAIKRYVKDLVAEPWRKAQNGSTFFTSGYVDYLDENYEEPKQEPKSGNTNAYVPEPPKYEKFKREEWENTKGTEMPESMRKRLREMFGGAT